MTPLAARLPVPTDEFGPWDVLSGVAHGHYVDGDAEACLRACRDGLVVARAAGDQVSARYLQYVACLAHEEAGAWSTLRQGAEAMLAELPEAAGPSWRAKVLGLYSHALMQQDQTTAALDVLAEGYGLVMADGGSSYNRGSACQALSGPLAAVLLFKPALRLLELSAQILGDSLGALYAVLEQTMIEQLRGLLLELLGRDRAADAAYVSSARLALQGERLARLMGDTPGLLHALAALQVAFQRLRSEPVDVHLLERHADSGPATRESMLSRLALSSAVARTGDLRRGRELTEQVRRDADRLGEAVLLWVSTGWVAQLDEAEHGATEGTRRWRAVAVGHLERLLSDRAGRFEALVERRRVAEMSARVAREDTRLWEDALTSVGNRRLLDVLLADPASAARPAAFVDVDRFKAVNDVHGHEAGDRVLQVVAGMLRSASRSGDVVARYGGDEFVVVLADGTDVEGFARRVRTDVAAHDWGAVALGLDVSVSIGVDAGGAGALERADEELRRAKARRPTSAGGQWGGGPLSGRSGGPAHPEAG